jgi:hypothetical protein
MPFDIGARNKPTAKPVLLLLLIEVTLVTLAKFIPPFNPIWARALKEYRARRDNQ